MTLKYRAIGVLSVVVATFLGLSAPAGAVIWDPDGRYERGDAVDHLETVRKRAAGPFAVIRVEESRIGVDRCELVGPVIASRGSGAYEQSVRFRVSVPCVGKPTERGNDAEADGFVSCGGAPQPILSNERVKDAEIVVVPRRAHAVTASVSVDELLFFDGGRTVPASPYNGQVENAEAEVQRLSALLPGEPDFPALSGSTWRGEHPSGLVLELRVDEQIGDESIVGVIQASHQRAREHRDSPMSSALDILEQITFKYHTALRASFGARLLRPTREYEGGFGPVPGSGDQMILRLRMLAPDEMEAFVHHERRGPSIGSPIVLTRAEGPMSELEYLTAPVALGGTGELVMGPEGSGPPTFDRAPPEREAPEVGD